MSAYEKYTNHQTKLFSLGRRRLIISIRWILSKLLFITNFWSKQGKVEWWFWACLKHHKVWLFFLFFFFTWVSWVWPPQWKSYGIITTYIVLQDQPEKQNDKLKLETIMRKKGGHSFPSHSPMAPHILLKLLVAYQNSLERKRKMHRWIGQTRPVIILKGLKEWHDRRIHYLELHLHACFL